MSDIKLFKIDNEINEIPASSVNLERDLQILIEQNMNTFFGVTFLKSEYTNSNGRIDSLGIDENNCPVIFEYKRTGTENVVNQGLFYLDWLLDHKESFEMIVMKTLGQEYSEKLDWSMPRLICVAGNFTKYDEYAVKQINRNIDLVRYKKFGEKLILFELVNFNTAEKISVNNETKKYADKTFEAQLESTTPELKNLYLSIRDYIMALGDDITENQLKLYVAFKKIKNIICAEVYQSKIILSLRLNPDDVEITEGFTRNIRGIGHFGTGDLEKLIQQRAKI